MNTRTLLLLVSLLLPSGHLIAATQFSSDPEQTLLLELYTSEGCNSCPPAEAYLNSYAQHPDLWTRVIPLAFHVDYWDGLGWKDHFAAPEHTERQRHYADQHSASTVYTPAFIANGKSWRPSFLNRSPSVPRTMVGTLEVVVEGQRVLAKFDPVTPGTTPLQLNVALLGMALTTHIKAGENAGRLAHHDFVVLNMTRATSTTLRWELELPTTKILAAKHALAVWVNQEEILTPLQATGGFLD